MNGERGMARLHTLKYANEEHPPDGLRETHRAEHRVHGNDLGLAIVLGGET